MPGTTAETGALGARLRALRIAAGLSQTALAQTIGIRQPHLANAEAGRARLSKARLRALLAATSAPLAVVAELAGGDAPEEDRSAAAARTYLAQRRALSAHEERAVEHWVWAPLVLPEVVQTRAYAEAVQRAAGLRGPVVGEAAALLSVRQAAITAPGRRLTVVLAPRAVEAPVLSGPQAQEQLRRLEVLARRPGVRILVADPAVSVPGCAIHRGPRGGGAVALETSAGLVLLTGAAEAAGHIALIEQISAAARPWTAAGTRLAPAARAA